MSEPDSLEFSLLVKFPDQSPSFTHGFEAGQIWTEFKNGVKAISERIVHAANEQVLRDIAKELHYHIVFEVTEYPDWLRMDAWPMAVKPKKSHLKVVK